MMKRTSFAMLTSLAAVSMLVLACGKGGEAAPPAAPTPEPTPEKAAPPADPEPAAQAAQAAQTTPASEPAKPAAEPVAEPCEASSGWVCVRISLDGKNKVEKRPTKLLGDPKIEQTWSKTTDGRGPMALDMPGRSFEVTLKRTTSSSAVVTVKTGKGPDVVVDKHEGDDFSYIGLISAEADDALMIDIRYMK